MPSTRLADAAPALAQAWVDILHAYRDANAGHDLMVTATYRSPQEQAALYRKGRVLIGGTWVIDDNPTTSVVTNIDGMSKLSRHNSQPAEALDFAVLIGGKVSWDAREYHPVGVLAKARGLVWGGDWVRLRDYPHLELPVE